MGNDVENKAAMQSTSRGCNITNLLLRIIIVPLCIIALTTMVYAKQTVILPFLGARDAKWTYVKAFVSIVVLSAICLAYSTLQAIAAASGLSKSNSKRFAWITFLADQILTYILLGVAAASTEVAYIAVNGAPKSMWREVCPTFDSFCRKAGISIGFTFAITLAMAITSVISAQRLFRLQSHT